MVQIAEIITYLEELAPLSYQEKYDNSGLIIGDKNKTCTGALITLDCTEAIIDEAIQLGCNLIIAHHPIVFSGLKKITGKNYVERVVIQAIKNDIAIYAIHTNLDNQLNGVNQKIAEKLCLTNTKILVPKNDTVILKKLITYVPTAQKEQILNTLFKAGAGSIGNYRDCSFSTIGLGTFKPLEGSNPTVGQQNTLETVEESRVEVTFEAYLERKILQALKEVHPYEEVAYQMINTTNSIQTIGAGIIGELENEMNGLDFLVFLKEKMALSCIRYTALCHQKIKKIAVCGGAGSFLLADAIAAGAEVLVTADFKYHQFFDAENKIIIADIGHYESEHYTKELLHAYLTKKFIKFASYISNINTNPVNYL